MTRRDLNSLVVRAAATAAGSAFFGSWLAGASYKPQFFSPEEFAAIERFTDLLIPTDDTPGAREAQVAEFIDFMVFSAHEYAPEMQSQWKSYVEWFRGKELDTKLMSEMSQPEHAGHHVFQSMKQFAVYGYYTSRAGLIENLQYKGVSYLMSFPACTHPEHNTV